MEVMENSIGGNCRDFCMTYVGVGLCMCLLVVHMSVGGLCVYLLVYNVYTSVCTVCM